MTVITKGDITFGESTDEDYGYRTIINEDEHGNTIIEYRPLTLDDFLDPEEGDVLMQGTVHEEDVDKLKSIFRYHLRNRPDVVVYSDLKICWGIPGLSEPAPDVSVFADVRDPKKPRGRFNVVDEGGIVPFFILEVVSPRYRNPDYVKKPSIYERAGVTEYVIIDSWLIDDDVSYEVFGYRLVGGRYVEIQPNANGWVYSQTTDVWIGMTKKRDRFVVVDGQTGEEILSDDKRADIAEEKAKSVEAELAHLKAEMSRLKVEKEQ
jgi:Uma2 family endonuclease